MPGVLARVGDGMTRHYTVVPRIAEVGEELGNRFCHRHRTADTARRCMERKDWYNAHDLVAVEGAKVVHVFGAGARKVRRDEYEAQNADLLIAARAAGVDVDAILEEITK